jgi:hypothetical protein
MPSILRRVAAKNFDRAAASKKYSAADKNK